MGGTTARPVSLEGLRDELTRVWEAGLNHLRSLALVSLTAVAEQCDAGTRDVVASIEILLRKAIEGLEGGREANAAAYLFGLAPHSRGGSPNERRAWAAEAYGISYDSFRRKKPERLVYEAVANMVLVLREEARLRVERTKLETRQPAESRLAVQWVERFEAYNRIWTPVYALGADLTAYRSTLLEPGRPYDDTEDVWTNVWTGETFTYSQEFQAEGYARFALYRFAEFLWQVKQFKIRHGGLWLLSDAETEAAVGDAIYRIGWHSPWNERDDSWLRSAFDDARGRELHAFLNYLRSTGIGQETHQEWQEWVATCECRWDPDQHRSEQEYFPTHGFNPGISADCQVHCVVGACGEYCDLIDRDWNKIADWYHDGDMVRRGRSGQELLRELRATGRIDPSKIYP